jgi:hypothetical protein
VAVVLLAHATRHEVTSIDGVTVEKSAPDFHVDLVNTLIEWSDFVAAARMNVNNREMVLNESAQQLAKNRYGIAAPLPLNWNALFNEIVKSQQPAPTPNPEGEAPRV